LRKKPGQGHHQLSPIKEDAQLWGRGVAQIERDELMHRRIFWGIRCVGKESIASKPCEGGTGIKDGRNLSRFKGDWGGGYKRKKFRGEKGTILNFEEKDLREEG